jgi:hypothetical protein
LPGDIRILRARDGSDQTENGCTQDDFFHRVFNVLLLSCHRQVAGRSNGSAHDTGGLVFLAAYPVICADSND